MPQKVALVVTISGLRDAILKLLGSAHETKNKVLLGLPRIIRLKENAPELDYSSFRFGGKLRFRKLGVLFAHMGVGYVAAERMRQNIVPLEVRP